MPPFERLDDLVRMARVVPPSAYAIERQLMNTKHFPYRFLSPLEATLVFGRAYREQMKNFIRSSVDIELAERIKGVSLTAPSEPTKDFTQLWKARVLADQFLLPYTQYIRFCLEFAGRRTRKIAPRPNQLGPNSKTAFAWTSEFEKILRSGRDYYFNELELPSSFRIEAFQDLPPQRAFRDTLNSHLQHSPTSYSAQLAKWWSSKRVIEPGTLLARISDENKRAVIAQLKSDLGGDRIGYPNPTPFLVPKDVEMLPSCFAVPYAQDDAAPACSSCPISEGCKREGLYVQLKAGLDVDSSDPEGDYERTLQRKRTARFRKRQAGTPAAPCTL